MSAAPRDVVELTDLPALRGLYARGVAGSVRAQVDRSRTLAPTALPTTQVVVRGVGADRDHLAEYQHVVGENGGDQLPAGYVHVLAFPAAMALMVRPEFPLPLLGMVHTANRVTQHRALTLGDTMDVAVHAQDLRPHRSGVTVDVVAEVTVDGATAWEGVSTYLAKGVHLRDGEPVADARRDDDGAPPVPTGQWQLGADV
ncbi:dehydratase, partial [Cellulomonas bogoriensis 69B4 = DSM 16987]